MYTLEYIETVLRHLGHQSGIVANGNDKAVFEFDCYFYPFQTELSAEIILRDLLDYLAIKNPAMNRRVGFLSTTASGECFALMLECKNMDTNAVVALNTFVINNAELSCGDLLRNKSFLELLKSIYVENKAIYLSSGQAVPNWNQWLRAVYRQAKLDIQPLPNTDATLIFTEYTHHFFKQGRFPRDKVHVDSALIYHSHGIAVLNNKLRLLQAAEPECYSLIIKALQVLAKYALLQEKRMQLTGIIDSLEQIELIQAQDLHFKKSIYSETIGIEHFLKRVSPKAIHFLVNAHAEQMLKILYNEQAQQLELLLEWQQNLRKQQAKLAQSWKNYLGWKLKKAGQAIYQNSLIGIGAELFKWSGDTLVNVFSTNQLIAGATHHIKKKAQSFMRWLDFLPSFADRAAKMQEQLSIINYKIPILKGIGGGVGLVATWFIGPYQLLRGMIVTKASFQLSQMFKKEELDDHDAQVVSYSYLPDNGSYVRIMNVLLASSEAAYFGNYIHLASALLATVSSVTTTELAKNLVPSLQVAPGQTSTEGQVLALFFISMGSLAASQLLIHYGAHVMEHLDDCRQAKDAFATLTNKESARYLSATAECSTQPNLASFLLRDESPLYLNWVTPNKEFFEANCFIKHNQGQAVCDGPIQLYTLRINT